MYKVIYMNSLCIVPVYNEELRLPTLIRKIKFFKKRTRNIDFIFINNGSNDKSLSLIKKNNFSHVSLKKNMGVGYALILGLKLAIKRKYEIIIHLAGNGKMLPSEIPTFINQIKNKKFDFVNGSRFLKYKIYQSTPLYRIFLIRILSFFISIIYDKKITDATCGFRAFKTEIFKNFMKNLDKKKFYTYGYEYYSIGKVISSKKLKFLEVPVTMQYPKTGPYTKMTPVIDWIIMIYSWLLAILDQKKLN